MFQNRLLLINSSSSRVYSFAIFDTIQKDEEHFGEQCIRFRDTIMKPGGSRPGKELLADFFGKELSLREIVQEFGVENV
jgi:Zn-dependent oligopeptidase